MGLKKKLYEDYFKKSRLKKYKDILLYAKNSGYQMVGIEKFNEMAKSGLLTGNQKILLNRHDIDTSPRVTKEMFDIEKEVYGSDGTSTFYFRDTTVDKRLIADIEAFGYETGYHYETIANYEKKNKLRNKTKLQEKRDILGKQFASELRLYRQKTNSKSKSVASHGDFVNVRLDLPNYWLLDDYSLRKELSVDVEAYDESIMKYVKKRLADHTLGVSFPDEVRKAIAEEIPVIMILTHPRNWKRDVIDTTRENCRRLWQGILYKM